MKSIYELFCGKNKSTRSQTGVQKSGDIFMISPSWKYFLVHYSLAFLTMITLVISISFALMFIQYAEKIKSEFFDVLLSLELCYVLILLPYVFVTLLYVSGLDFVWLNYGEKK